MKDTAEAIKKFRLRDKVKIRIGGAKLKEGVVPWDFMKPVHDWKRSNRVRK
jgi:hypothetical protein